MKSYELHTHKNTSFKANDNLVWFLVSLKDKNEEENKSGGHQIYCKNCEKILHWTSKKKSQKKI